jgi:GDP-mannose 6-dehydrogenase
MLKIPHLQNFVTDDLKSVVEHSDVLVITNKEQEFDNILKEYPHKIIIDLVRTWKDVDYDGVYEGLSWGNINVNLAQNKKISKDIKVTEF